MQGAAVYSINKNRSKEKNVNDLGKCTKDIAAAQHFLSPLSSSFVGVKFLYDFGLWGSCLANVYSMQIKVNRVIGLRLK
jgi:hypothetical protein